MNRNPAFILLFACAIVLPFAPGVACGEQGDREKPINYSADTGDVNYQTKVGNLAGNVVITQGTLMIRADRMAFRQNADNSLSVTAYGNPVSFRQKRDKVDEYYEGFAQRVEYDGQKQLVELFDRALLKRGQDEIRSNYISYNTATEYFRAEGRPDAATAPPESGPGARVRGVFQPKSGEGIPGLPGKESAKGEGAKGEGAKGEGAKGEGAKGESTKGESTKGEGAKGDAAKSEGGKGSGKAKDATNRNVPDKAGEALPLPLRPSGDLAAPAARQ